MRFPSFGCCIYCRETNVGRGEEHIVPFSLGGRFVIDDASCSACAKKINKFESAVGRAVFGNFRMKYGLRTRRPKQRPKDVDLNMGAAGVFRVPAQQHPSPVVLYEFDFPGITVGLPPFLEMGGWTPAIVANLDEMNALNDKYGGHFHFSSKMQPDTLARQLAKIAYGFAIVHIGINSFQPLIMPLILGTDANWSYLVGRPEREIYGPFRTDHEFHIEIEQVLGRRLVTVDVILFPLLNTPRYKVIVGEIATSEQRYALLQHLRYAEAVVGPLSRR